MAAERLSESGKETKSSTWLELPESTDQCSWKYIVCIAKTFKDKNPLVEYFLAFRRDWISLYILRKRTYIKSLKILKKQKRKKQEKTKAIRDKKKIKKNSNVKEKIKI